MLKWILLGVFFLSSVGAMASDFFLFTGLAYARHVLADPAFSPRIYRGSGYPLLLRCELQTDRFRHRLDLQGTSSFVIGNAYPIESENGRRLDNWHRFAVDYSIVRRQLLSSPWAREWYWGLGWSNRFFLKEYSLTNGTAWELTSSLDACLGLQIRPIADQSLDIYGRLALLGYVHGAKDTFWQESFQQDYILGHSLIPYGRLATLADMLQFSLTAIYRLSLGRRWLLAVEASLDGERWSLPRSLNRVTTDLRLWLGVRL